ncbi:TPA: hypothetical protein ACQFK9_000422 [Proteus mirabilis]
MEKFILDNIIAVFSGIISIFSLIISILSLSLGKRNSRLASYNMRGNYKVYFRKENWKEKFVQAPSFSMKIFNSITSDSIRFEYKLQITPITGGVSRVQLFDGLEKNSRVGINRTGPVIINKTWPKNKFPKKYAYESFHEFVSSPFFSYFTVHCKGINGIEHFGRTLNRYHQYLEITDFNGNTEIWYFAFSLYLSNLDVDHEPQRGWRKLKKSCFKYYNFSEIVVFSPKDLIKNIKESLIQNKTLEEISGYYSDNHYSERLAKEGFLPFDNDLQVYELREYLQFSKMIKEHV